MIFVLYLALTLACAAASVILRSRRTIAHAVAIVGLAASIPVAFAIDPATQLTLGGSTLEPGIYGRTLLLLGSVTMLALLLVAWAGREDHAPAGGQAPAAALILLGGFGIAISTPGAPAAFTLLVAAAIAALLVVAVDRPAGLRGSIAGGDARILMGLLRRFVPAGLLAVIAAAWTAGATPDTSLATTIALGLALLGIGLLVVFTSGTLPFHGWASRLGELAPRSVRLLLIAWLPAVISIVALAWAIGPAGSFAVPLSIERGLLIAAGIASLIFGLIATFVQDDLERFVRYATLHDAGWLVLALTIPDQAGWPALRTWVLVFVLAKSALAAWAIALELSFGSRSIDALDGWARRNPVLAAGLVAIALGTIGWPTLAAFEARMTIASTALVGPLAWIAIAAGFGSLAYCGRLLVIGFRRPSALVGGAPSPWARVPSERVAGLAPLDAARVRGGAGFAAVVVLALGLATIVVASGWLGTTAAAQAAAPQEPIATLAPQPQSSTQPTPAATFFIPARQGE